MNFYYFHRFKLQKKSKNKAVSRHNNSYHFIKIYFQIIIYFSLNVKKKSPFRNKMCEKYLKGNEVIILIP